MFEPKPKNSDNNNNNNTNNIDNINEQEMLERLNKSKISLKASSGLAPKCKYSNLSNHIILPHSPRPREYQLEMVLHSLFTNSLIVLPTGLGKTYVASIVIYNYYLHFQHGCLIFLAPT